MNNFRQSNEYAMRRAARDCIRKAKGLTRSEREILWHVTSLWYHHRNSAGLIYPGREAVAKKCRCSVRTVASALKRFRHMGFISPVKYAKGGSKATRYTVDISCILMTLDGFLLSLSGGFPELVKGETRISLQHDDIIAVSEKSCTVHKFPEPCKNCTRIINTCEVEKDLNQKDNCVVLQFPKPQTVGVGNV